MEDLTLYQSMIDQKANERSTEVLPNAGESHAAIVMSKMFENTKKSVNMIVGSLDTQVCNQNNYFKELEKCRKKGVDFKVIFLDEPDENSLAYQILKKGVGKNVQMKRASESVKTSLTRLKEPDNPIHFSVFDDDKYRYEKDSKKFLALVCFNDKKNAHTLKGFFDDYFSESTSI